MEFETLLNEMEQVLAKSINANEKEQILDEIFLNSKQGLEQILYLSLDYLEYIYNNNYNNLLLKSENIRELYRSLFLQCNHNQSPKIRYLITHDNNHLDHNTRDFKLNNYYGQINKYNCRKCNNFIHLKHSFWNDFTYNMHDFIPPPKIYKKKIFIFGWCRFDFNNNTALCPNCKKPHMNELLQKSSCIFISNGINSDYLNVYNNFNILKVTKSHVPETKILKNNAYFTIKLKDDKYFYEHKHWIIETEEEDLISMRIAQPNYDSKVKESLKNENLIKQIINANNDEEYFENIIDDNNNKDIIINNIFNENICSYIGIDFVKSILNLSTALGINLKKKYKKYYSYLFNYFNVNCNLNYNLMMLNDLYKNLLMIKKYMPNHLQSFIDLNNDNYYTNNLFEYYPSKKLQFVDCIYCKKSFWFLELESWSNTSFIKEQFDKNKNMYNEMTLLKNKHYSCVCGKCTHLL